MRAGHTELRALHRGITVQTSRDGSDEGRTGPTRPRVGQTKQERTDEGGQDSHGVGRAVERV